MGFIILDYETRSHCNLKEKGTYQYAFDPSTQILCGAAVMYDPEDHREWLWYPVRGEDMPEDLKEEMMKADLIMAHNAIFDQLIHECVGVADHDYPFIPQDKWYCTSAQSRLNAMPASLDDMTKALDSKFKKNHKGDALIKKLSIPQEDGTFNEDPELITDMGEYCLDDCKATKSGILQLRLMTQEEHEEWLINERINNRGIKIDRKLATHALNYAADEQQEIAIELHDLTGGYVTKHTQYQRISKWVVDRLPQPRYEAALKLMTVYKKDKKTYSTARDIRTQLLGRADVGEIELPDEVYNVIAALDDGARSSVAKFRKMLEMADPETDRVYGAFVCYGAQSTLRFSSRGLQVHNFRRDVFKDDEFKIYYNQMVNGDALSMDGEPMPVMDTLSRMLRPAIKPERGNSFVVGDWSGIEARALPWLSGDPRAEKVLDLFRNNEDVYVNAAGDANIADPAGPGRQVGKVIVLSLGFGGAEGAFSGMAKNYNVFLPDHEVTRIVQTWRSRNQWAVDFWNALHNAAFRAIQHPGTPFTAGRVKYMFAPGFIDGTLFCELPGNLLLQYPKARIEMTESDWGTNATITSLKANWKPKADEKEWPRVALWRGLLAENVTQAFCAKLLRNVLKQFDNTVLHVHDEIGLEVPTPEAEAWRDKLQIAMETVPEWAAGLPLTADPKIMDRYGK